MFVDALEYHVGTVETLTLPQAHFVGKTGQPGHAGEVVAVEEAHEVETEGVQDGFETVVEETASGVAFQNAEGVLSAPVEPFLTLVDLFLTPDELFLAPVELFLAFDGRCDERRELRESFGQFQQFPGQQEAADLVAELDVILERSQQAGAFLLVQGGHGYPRYAPILAVWQRAWQKRPAIDAWGNVVGTLGDGVARQLVHTR